MLKQRCTIRHDVWKSCSVFSNGLGLNQPTQCKLYSVFKVWHLRAALKSNGIKIKAIQNEIQSQRKNTFAKEIDIHAKTNNQQAAWDTAGAYCRVMRGGNKNKRDPQTCPTMQDMRNKYQAQAQRGGWSATEIEPTKINNLELKGARCEINLSDQGLNEMLTI